MCWLDGHCGEHMSAWQPLKATAVSANASQRQGAGRRRNSGARETGAGARGAPSRRPGDCEEAVGAGHRHPYEGVDAWYDATASRTGRVARPAARPVLSFRRSVLAAALIVADIRCP